MRLATVAAPVLLVFSSVLVFPEMTLLDARGKIDSAGHGEERDPFRVDMFLTHVGNKLN